MFCRSCVVLLMILCSSLCPGSEKLHILDTALKGMAFQEYFGRVFASENAALPQELEINISGAVFSEIEKLPPKTVIADDGLSKKGKLTDLKRDVYAVQPLIFAVNKNNPLNDLDTETLRRIYSGRAGRWERIGGGTGRVIIGGASQNSLVYRIFRKKVMLQELDGKASEDITKNVAPGLIECTGVDAAVSLLQAAEGAIVFGGAKLAENVQGKYKILKVDNVYPSMENILSGKYKLTSSPAIFSRQDDHGGMLAELLRFLRKAAKVSGDMLVVENR